MSDTPRTDGFEDGLIEAGMRYCGYSHDKALDQSMELARVLERELAAVTAERDIFQANLASCRELLGLVMDQPTDLQVALDNAKRKAWVRAEELGKVKEELADEVRRGIILRNMLEGGQP